jgi:hypothetical protein
MCHFFSTHREQDRIGAVMVPPSMNPSRTALHNECDSFVPVTGSIGIVNVASSGRFLKCVAHKVTISCLLQREHQDSDRSLYESYFELRCS